MDGLSFGPSACRHVIFPHSAPLGGVINFTGSSAESAVCVAHDAAPTEEDAFVRWLFQEAGLEARIYKPETLRRRMAACLRALRVTSINEARVAVQRNGANLRTALSAMVIGVTSFFRDPLVFEALGRDVLPELTSRGSGARIWSVGCSDGPELYSVAMLLAEQAVLHRCYLLGTDCRADAISRAAEGVYDADAVRSLPPHLLAKYLVAEGPRWRMKPWLRTVVQWRAADALAVQEPGAWDLILCRNMAIYLSGRSSAQLWQKLAESLRPGGVLVLGKAERPLGTRGLLSIGPCFYRRTAH